MLKTAEAWLVYRLVQLLAATYRIRFAGAMPVPQTPGGTGYILAIWHQNLFAGILAQIGRRHVVIISRSRDGDVVTDVCERMGHHVSRGSSRKGSVDKGGKQAKDEMIAMLRSGLPGAVTVDGPRGPAHVVKPGIIDMARVTGLPIVPYLPLPRRYWSLRSWDAFRLPKPFSEINVHYGEPIHVPSDICSERFEQYQQQLGQALQRLELSSGFEADTGAAPL